MEENILDTSGKEDKFFSKETGMHLFGYSLVGGITNLIEIGLLFVLVDVYNFWYLLASVIVFTLGSFVSFTLRKIFVFKKRGFNNLFRQLASYIFIFLIGLSINAFIMTFCVEVIKIHYAAAYILAVLVTGCVGFLWNKKITFGMKED